MTDSSQAKQIRAQHSQSTAEPPPSSGGGSQIPAQRPQSTARGVWWRVLLVLSVLMLLFDLDYAPFFNPDEGRYASASLEMARGFDGAAPDWVVPHLNGVPRLNKPPLVYWTTALSIRVFGATETAGRMPSALSAIAVMALIWWLGRAVFDRRAATFGALIWATATFSFVQARVLNTDMLLCAAMTLSLCGVWPILEAVRGHRRASIGAVATAGIGMGLALLAKGPVGLLLPIVIGFVALIAGYWQPDASATADLKALIAAYWRPDASVTTDLDAPARILSSASVAMRRTLRDLRGSAVLWAGVGGATLIALMLALPWAMAISERVPDFWRRFLFEENLGRFSGGVEFHKSPPLWIYLPVVLVGLLPWTAFLALTSPRRSALEESESPAEVDLNTRARRFLWAWALVVIGLFTLSSTKLVTYILPAFPALCLLLGEGLRRVEIARIMPRAWSWAIGLTIGINVLLAVAVAWFLSDNKTIPRGEGLPFVLALCAVLLGGSLLLWMVRGRGVAKVFATIWATAMLLHIGILATVGRVALYEDAGTILQALRPHLRPTDRIVLYREFQPTAIFYFGGPVTVVDFLNTSGLDDEAIRSSRYFVADPDDRPSRFLGSGARTFLLYDVNNQIARRDLKSFATVARNNDFVVVSNRAAPPDFHFDYVAPAKRN